MKEKGLHDNVVNLSYQPSKKELDIPPLDPKRVKKLIDGNRHLYLCIIVD